MPVTATQAAQLAPGWETTSYHEAGHALAALELGLPVHQVSLRYERRFLRWAVVGQTAVAPPGHTIEVDETRELLFTVAGIEAEAQWLVWRDNIDFPQERRLAESNPVNQAGDMAEIAACLPAATFTYAEAQQWAFNLFAIHWHTVSTIAQRLRDTGHITGRQLAHLA
jgi:hypothetical protein